jgi:glycoside/pentoside/hexuronide:cation symporter, GPH family
MRKTGRSGELLLNLKATEERVRVIDHVQDKVPPMEKIGYSLGDSASNLYWKVFEFFLVFFYTDVFGISAAAAGTMLLVTCLASAAMDLLVGVAADHTRTRWGHFRPYLLWASVPLCLAGVLTFTTPHLDGGFKLLYAYITYGSLMFAYSAVNVPYSALMGVMTQNSAERTSISSIRFLGAFTAAVFVQYFTLRFVKLFGQGSEAHGWQLTMVLYGALAMLLLLLCFISTNERVVPSRLQDANLKSDFQKLISSRPWSMLVGVQVISLAAFAIKSSASAYYFKYFVKRQDLLGLFLLSNGLAFLAAVSLTPLLSKRVGKKHLFAISLGLGGLVVGLCWLAGPSDIRLMFVLQIVSSFAIGFKSPLIFAMFADTADHTEWRTGRRCTGLFFASAILATRIGLAVGAWLFGIALAYCGYVGNVEQTGRSLRGIILSMSGIPCLMLLLCSVAMVFYPLDDTLMIKIEKDLKEWRDRIRT